MEETIVSCKSCGSRDFDDTAEEKTCRLCNEVHCGECLNEAGYCAPCAEKMNYSKGEAIAV